MFCLSDCFASIHHFSSAGENVRIVLLDFYVFLVFVLLFFLCLSPGLDHKSPTPVWIYVNDSQTI